jgi:hypothetical protein
MFTGNLFGFAMKRFVTRGGADCASPAAPARRRCAPPSTAHWRSRETFGAGEEKGAGVSRYGGVNRRARELLITAYFEELDKPE